MSFDLTNKNIQDTFQNLLQKTGSDNQLYDLKGNAITNLTISGTLNAQSYIVSQSTTVHSSGSTAFGNSADDTHTFQGQITASGNISSSGFVYGDRFMSNNKTVATYTEAFDTVYYTDGTPKTQIQGRNIKLTAPITASGDISSSGDVYLSDLHIPNNKTGGSTHGHIFFESSTGAVAKQLTITNVDTLVLGNNNNKGIHITSGTQLDKFCLSVVSQSGHIGVGTSKAPERLTVEGNISSSGDLVLGNLGTGAYISGSNGGLEISGSGTGLFQIEGDISSSGATIHSKNTIADSDATPSVANGTYFETGTATDTITTFDGGSAGQIIYVISKAAITYDVTGTTLKCGTTDLVTAAGDLTTWLYDGTNWTCIGFTDQSDDLS